MLFKIHLLIVSVIIIVIYIVMQVISVPKQQPQIQPITETIKISPYNIIISHASWGLNCLDSSLDRNAETEGSYTQPSKSNSKIKDDNVISKVSQLCNGKPKCAIALNPSALGEDPLPTCGYKKLQIEYRCFSIDRIRKIEANEAVLTINCDAQFDNPS